MTSPLQSLLAAGVLPPVTFPTDSRYYGSATLNCTVSDGRTESYLARRIVPQPSSGMFSTVARHVVSQGDRLDLIAARYLGDPLLSWLICDANGALRPQQLLQTPGTTLLVTMSLGIPGGTGA
jgi:hypothetical protein